MKHDVKNNIGDSMERNMICDKKYGRKHCIVILLALVVFMLFSYPVSALGDFKFDFVTKVGGTDNYTKHWSNTYPPDANANIIIYSYTGNVSFNRISAISYVYVTYDPLGNIVAVDRKDMFQRNYDSLVYYYILHPRSDWVDGNYKVKIVVLDRVDKDEDVWDELTNDPVGIATDIEKYKRFYETGGNANDVGVLRDLGPIKQEVLYFNINKSVSIYPPDRFFIHDLAFVDGNNERVIGEQLKIDVKVDNNYAGDGTFKMALLVDNGIVATQDVTVKGQDTSTVIFEAKAGKVGTFKLSVGTDTPDAKMIDTELTFTIKNETETTRLDVPKIEVTLMNVDKEFVPVNSNITVSVTVVNNGKTGNKTITIYSNKIPVGSATIDLQYLEEKIVEIPITLDKMGINKITVSDASQLYRNVFVQEEITQKSPIQRRIEENPLKVSAVVVLIVFAVVLYYLRKKLLK